MTHSTIAQQTMQQINQLPVDLQRKVLDFAQALVLSLPKGTPGQNLLRFAAIMDPDDIQAMTQAIKKGCERVDTDEW